MAPNTTIEGFIKRFSRKSHFSKNDLLTYYLKSEPDLKDGTLRRRIALLKKRGIIHEVSRGIYSLQNKPLWIPAVENSVKSIYSKIAKHYIDINCCVWSTAWLNEFTNLQAFRHIIVIEAEKDVTQSVYEYLTDTGMKNLYFKPDRKEATYYLSNASQTHVVETLYTKSPLQLVKNTWVPRLEKILVDLFCDKDLFLAYQGSEMENIFRNAFKTYAVNNSMLLNYSRRRGREKELSDYIKNKIDIKLPVA